MKNLDRILVLVLAVGVWALVLKPTTITAHDSNSHRCHISGSADGWILLEQFVTIDDWNSVYIECYH